MKTLNDVKAEILDVGEELDKIQAEMHAKWGARTKELADRRVNLLSLRKKMEAEAKAKLVADNSRLKSTAP